MGRSKPTFRNYLDGVVEEWQPYRRTLRRRYQDDFDSLFEKARAHADAAGQLDPADPRLAILFSMLLAQEHELRQLRERLEGDADGVPPGEGGPTSGRRSAADGDRTTDGGPAHPGPASEE